MVEVAQRAGDCGLPREERPGETFGQRLGGLWRTTFIDGWSPVVGGAVLGVIVVMMYMLHIPWGVIGELSRWAQQSMNALSVGAPDLKGLSDIGGCAARAGEAGRFTHAFAVSVGLMPGALVGALFAGEFKLRFPPRPYRSHERTPPRGLPWFAPRRQVRGKGAGLVGYETSRGGGGHLSPQPV